MRGLPDITTNDHMAKNLETSPRIGLKPGLNLKKLSEVVVFQTTEKHLNFNNQNS